MKVSTLGATTVLSGHTPVTGTLYSQNIVDESWRRGRDHERTWKPGIVEYIRIYEASWRQLTERLEKIRSENCRLISTPTLTVTPWSTERLQQVNVDQEPHEYNEVFANYSRETTHNRNFSSISVQQNLNSVEPGTENKAENFVTNKITSSAERMVSDAENSRNVLKVTNVTRVGKAKHITTPQRNKYCRRCGNTAYVTENIEPNRGATFHHGCFRCLRCSTKLSLQTFFTSDDEVYCRAHVPKPSYNVSNPNRERFIQQ